MWILPKSLTSRYVPGMAESTSDSDAASRCAQLLMRRSKPSQSSAYLREWKAGNLTRLRSGLICDPFLGTAFEIEYTCSLEVIPASPSQQPVNDLEPTTPGTSGQALQRELLLCDPESVSSRTSKDTSVSDSERSLQTWNALVTKRRGEYLARLNAVRRTSVSEYSSWPSPVASEVRQGFQDRSRGMKGTQESLTTVVIKCGPLGPDNHSTFGSHQGSLNPRWVETLMGLPVGWTMPNCVQPMNPANQNSDCSETE
jgi:hypothetical protein